MTIDYYNKNAEYYFNHTKDVDMQNIYIEFEKRIKQGAYILDVGCGSGRDSKYFLQNGYKVDAIDGSEGLCKLASEYLGINVECKRFNEIKICNQYDAIWACASLLHISMEELKCVYFNLFDGLKSNGIFYSSFKYGNNEEEVDGKFYNNMNEDKIGKLLSNSDSIKEITIFYNYEKRSETFTQKWINLIVQKI